MGLIGFYFRKVFTLFKGEVLVLPSRIAVLVFAISLLLLPLFTQDSYLLRILILTNIFAILAASWDLLSGFTGQMNFGHALFFGVAAYMKKLAKAKVLILDDFGLSPMTAPERRELLEVVEDRHAFCSTIVATQLPIENWHENIRDPTIADAILDRLIHNAHKIKLRGESMRKLLGRGKNDTETTD